MLAPTTLCLQNNACSKMFFFFFQLWWNAFRIQRCCDTDRFNFCAWRTRLFKLFPDNNVDLCRIGLHCQVAPSRCGQTWRKRKIWRNMGALSGDFCFSRTIAQNHQNSRVSQRIRETQQVLNRCIFSLWHLPDTSNASFCVVSAVTCKMMHQVMELKAHWELESVLSNT